MMDRFRLTNQTESQVQFVYELLEVAARGRKMDGRPEIGSVVVVIIIITAARCYYGRSEGAAWRVLCTLHTAHCMQFVSKLGPDLSRADA